MEGNRDKLQLVLNTRSGTLNDKTDFSACTWRLGDPIFLPSNNYVMTVAMNFMCIPGDHFRINSARNSSRFHITKKVGGEWTQAIILQIPDNSYTVQSIIAALNLELTEAGYGFLKFTFDRPNAVFKLSVTDTVDDEYALATSEYVGQETGAEALGFYTRVNTGIKTKGETQTATLPADLQGTRTVTVKTSTGNRPNINPSSLTRKRNVLAVIPSQTAYPNTPFVWHRALKADSVLYGNCLDCIELSLEDDMGFALNPNSHWAASIDIHFTEKREIAVVPSKNFREYM